MQNERAGAEPAQATAAHHVLPAENVARPSREQKPPVQVISATGSLTSCHPELIVSPNASAPRHEYFGAAEAVVDITWFKRARDQTLVARHFAQRVADICPAMVYIYDLAQNCFVYCNREIETALGYTREQVEALGPDAVRVLMHPEDRARFAAHLGRVRALPDGETADLEYRMRHSDGRWRWFYGRDAVFSRDGRGGATRTIGGALDVTGRREAEALARHLAQHDALTGLPNRTLLADRLPPALARSARRGERVGLLLLDLDRFKDVNDT